MTTNKAGSRKTAMRKTVAKKAAAKKTAAKKTPAKKTPAQKTPAKKTVTRKTAAQKSALQKTATTKAHAGAAAVDGGVPSRCIDAKIEALGDWRGALLARIRTLVRQADPGVVEEWKWRGVPVWSHAGILCTGETYRHTVKMTFAKGAALDDPAGLFNASLDGNTRRAIDFRDGDEIDEGALKALIRAAVALNEASAAKKRGAKTRGATT